MNATRARIVLVASFLAALPAAAAYGGVIVRTVERDASGKEVSNTIVSAQDGRMRVENLKPGQARADNTVIFKDGGLLIVDHGRKTYTALDRATLQSMAGTVNKALQQMEQHMAGMSEEQRAMVARMLGKNAPGGSAPSAPLQVRKTDKRETVGAYNCMIWEAELGGQTRWQHCVVPFAEVPGGQEMLQVMKNVSLLMEEVSRSIDAGWLKDALHTGWEGVGAIDGYPVLTRTFRDGRPSEETVLQSASLAAIPAASFDPPAGYQPRQWDRP